MHLWFHHPRGLSCRGVSRTPRPRPSSLSRPLLVFLSVLSAVALAHAGLESPVFDTHTVPDPTPCDAVRFSWTGGVPPFVVFLDDPETLSIVSKSDDTEDHFVTWTPPPSAVGMTLMATVFDGDLSFDTTDEFVVQPASCLSASPPVPPASSVGLQPSTTPSTSLVHHTSPPISISPIRNSTASSESPTPFPSPSASSHVAPSLSPSISSPPPQPPQESSSIRRTGDSASTVPAHTITITGAPSATESQTSASSPGPSTTSHRRSTGRPRVRKSSAPSPSASEIVGIVLGSVRSPAEGEGSAGSSSSQFLFPFPVPKEDRSRPYAHITGLQLQSSDSTLAQRASRISTKATAPHHLHQYYSIGSPTMPPNGTLGSHPTPLQDEDGGDTSHLDDPCPPVPHPNRESLAPRSTVPVPLPRSHTHTHTHTHAGTGSGKPREAGAPTGVASRTLTEAETNNNRKLRNDMAMGISSEPGRTGTTQTEGGVSMDAAPGPSSRARRVTILLLLEPEGEGGVRLAGLPPDVTVEVEGERTGESLSGSDGLVDVDITRLPPPYHCYGT
ncbi:hypothetical protein V8D89_014361 [Ganoderma adspersum]